MHAYVCACVLVRVCMRVWMCVCVCVCVHLPKQLHILGMKGNPVVVMLSLIIAWTVVLVAVLQQDVFFDNAAEAKRFKL